MAIWLLDDSLEVRVGYDCQDADLKDNICLSFNESCPVDEKLFIADETHIFLTVEEATWIAEALMRAVHNSGQPKDDQEVQDQS